MSTAIMDRPTEVETPDSERLAHILRDQSDNPRFPTPALCGHICTRFASQAMPRCGECAAIYQRAR